MKVIQLAISVSGGRLPGGLSPGAIVNPRRSLMIISQQSILYRGWSGKYYRLFQRADRCCIFVEAAPVWILCCLDRTHERLKRIVNVSRSASDRKRWLNMSSKFADIQGDVFEKIFHQVGSGIAFRNPVDFFDKLWWLIANTCGWGPWWSHHQYARKGEKSSCRLSFKRKSETRKAWKIDLGSSLRLSLVDRPRYKWILWICTVHVWMWSVSYHAPRTVSESC